MIPVVHHEMWLVIRLWADLLSTNGIAVYAYTRVRFVSGLATLIKSKLPSIYSTIIAFSYCDLYYRGLKQGPCYYIHDFS